MKYIIIVMLRENFVSNKIRDISFKNSLTVKIKVSQYRDLCDSLFKIFKYSDVVLSLCKESFLSDQSN